MKYRKFPSNARTNFYCEAGQTLCRNWTPREVVEYPSLKMFKTQPHIALSNLM